MAISRVQAVSANASSATLSAAAAGDYIIVFAYNAGSTTIPTLATGFTSVDTQAPGASANASRIGYKVAAGGETSTGTWTSATRVSCIVLRGATGVGGFTPSSGNSAALAYGSITFTGTNGGSWVLGFGGAKAATAGMNGSTTLLANATAQTTVNALSSDAVKSSYAGETLNVTTSGRWITEAVEILGAVSHPSSGSLTGSAGAIAASATHTLAPLTAVDIGYGVSPWGSSSYLGARAAVAVSHPTSGALTGAGAAIAAAAAHVYAGTGVLSGPGAAVAGSAVHKTLHATSGSLAGQAGSIAGAALHPHKASGALSGAGAVVAGAALHPHTTSGALAGPGAVVVAAAVHPHLSSGAIAGPGATIAGASAHVHAASGSIAGAGSAVGGSAAHLVLHAASGDLAGAGASAAGDASRTGSAASFDTQGDIAAAGALLSGDAARYALHDAAGDLAGPGAQLAGQVLLVSLQPKGAPGYGGKPKKKYIVRKGDQLLVFTSEKDALTVLASSKEPQEIEAPAAKPAKKKVVREVIARAEEEVNIAEVQELARRQGQDETVQRMLAAAHYAALMALLRQMQDEEDLEMLLLAS